MAQMNRPRLQSVEAFENHTARLAFRNGAVFIVDFNQFFDESPGLEPLRDVGRFLKVQVDEWGWFIEWPELDIQMGADTLWLDAQAQNAPDENTRFFAGWRSRYGLSLKQAADALGLTVRTISAYSTGSRPIPKTVRLACVGWEFMRHSGAA